MASGHGVSGSRLFSFERAFTTYSHEFVAPADDQAGRVVDRYAIDSGAVAFCPSQVDGVEVYVHFGGDRLQVNRPASLVLRLCYVNLLGNVYEDNMDHFPDIVATIEHPSEGYPKEPFKLRRAGGFSQRGSQFSMVYKIYDNSRAFSFAGLRVSFKQRVSAGMTVYRMLYGSLEVTHLTAKSLDPGMPRPVRVRMSALLTRCVTQARSLN